MFAVGSATYAVAMVVYAVYGMSLYLRRRALRDRAERG